MFNRQCYVAFPNKYKANHNGMYILWDIIYRSVLCSKEISSVWVTLVTENNRLCFVYKISVLISHINDERYKDDFGYIFL